MYTVSGISQGNPTKPIVVYTVLTAFLAPWLDFVFVKVIVGPNDKY